MMTSHHSGTTPSLRRYASANRSSSQPFVERVLRFIGAEVSFCDDVLGDLAEERARRAKEQGERAAQWWYMSEALRSAPHIAWNAARHGGPQGSARVAFVGATLALMATVVVSFLTGEGSPVRMELDGQRGGDANGIIVNTVHPVRLTMHAFDADGDTLRSAKVRYRLLSGGGLSISSDGVLTCAGEGDAYVRAAVGSLATTVRVRCEPVAKVMAPMMMQYVVGDAPQKVMFVAVDARNRRVDRMAGEVRLSDTSVARLARGHIYPLAPGNTRITMNIGDGEASTWVSVFERVPSFEGLRADQHHVIAPVRLARGARITWPLPLGLFTLEYHRVADTDAVPTISVDGPVMCLPANDGPPNRKNCLVRGPAASVRIVHPGGSRPAIAGALSLEQQKYP